MKHLFKNSLFYVCLILFLAAGFLVVDFVGAVTSFSEPTESYPGGILEIPVDTSVISQDKKGDLSEKGKLTVKVLSITTSTLENSPVYLDEEGIWMREHQDLWSSRSPRFYWDDITSWSDASGGGIYYNDGKVGIGTDDLSSNAILNVDGRIDMSGNKIINVSSPAGSSDAATKGYVDPKFGIEVSGEISKEEHGCNSHSYNYVNYFSESSSEARFAHSVYGKLWDISTELNTSGWDFCFLTKIDRDSCGTTANKLRVMACEVMKGFGFVNDDGPLIGDGGWYLRVAADGINHTRCVARCVNFE